MPKPNSEMKIAAAALKLASRQGWSRLTLDDIARAAKIPPVQAKKLFPSKDNILPAIVRLIDTDTVTGIGKPDPKAAPHDRLFEVMMARMDALQNHRRAILGIMDETRCNLGMMRHLLPAQANSMRFMLDLADVKPKGPAEPIAVAGLLGIYGLSLCAWRSDHSRDMARTMAVLDRSLRRASKAAEILFRATA